MRVILFLITLISFFLILGSFKLDFFITNKELGKTILLVNNEQLKKEEIKKENIIQENIQQKQEEQKENNNQTNIKVNEEEDEFLSSKKIIEYTNQERIKNNLPPLKENEQLNISAEMKISDMFIQQYFDHTSPDGKEFSEIIKESGYDYISVAENLAMGDFKNEKEIVDGWMNSKGHRENILNPKFREIGVGIRKGILNDKEVWLVVQHFAVPTSVCPQPSKELSELIENNKNILNQWLTEMENLKNKIKRETDIYEKNKLIEAYNNLVEQYNNLIKNTEPLVNQYNSEIKKFNECMLLYKQ